MNFDDFKYNKKNLAQRKESGSILDENLKKEFHAEMLESHEHDDFFSAFDDTSVEAFKFHYAQTKAEFVQHYTYMIEDTYLHKELKHRDDTMKVLMLIQRKKLLNMRLLWQAERIRINEIYVAKDFEFWDKHVDVCPFLPAVTEEELKLLKEFLRSGYHDLRLED
jgi:hypothetical protein